MMESRFTHVSLARVVIETQTPLSVLSGHPEGTFDSSLLRDGNGLPLIPGTSLAGVLRSVVGRFPDAENPADPLRPSNPTGKSREERLFGYAIRENSTTDIQASRVSVSHGVLLNAQQEAMEGLHPHIATTRDPVLQDALKAGVQSNRRDRVRITDRGAAADAGLFDRAILTVGHRFAFEFRLHHRGSTADLADWDLLCNCLAHPLFRIGGGTRSGLGAVAISSVRRQTFDLRSDRVAFCAVKPSLHSFQGLEEQFSPKAPQDPRLLFARVTLKSPRSFWRIGTGDRPLGNYANNPPQLLPRRERRLRWSGKEPRFEDALLVAAAGIKGPLAHRTAFHANCCNEVWANSEGAPVPYDKSEHNPAVQWLFGTLKSGGKGRAETGQAGRVYLDDQFLTFGPEGDLNTENDVEHIHHNGIDRFTGGVRAQVLFSEEVLSKGQLIIPIVIDVTTDGALAPPHSLAALEGALEDLAEGRLAIGAGASRGYGVFQGSLEWPDSASDFEEHSMENGSNNKEATA